MKIDVKEGEAVISGYVNAVGRDSRPIPSARGAYVEQVQPGAFGRALNRAKNVDLLINHDRGKVLARTDNGSLRLYEDNVGLHAEVGVKDPQTVEQARRGEFRGWSFEFKKRDDAWETTANGTPRRILKDIDISEVSLIDGKKLPAYIGTTVEVRADGGEPENGERRFMEDAPVYIGITVEARADSEDSLEPVELSVEGDGWVPGHIACTAINQTDDLVPGCAQLIELRADNAGGQASEILADSIPDAPDGKQDDIRKQELFIKKLRLLKLRGQP